MGSGCAANSCVAPRCPAFLWPHEIPMIRPKPARWFEILAARDDATLALEALASTGAVELEARAAAALPHEIAEARPLLQQFRELAQRYRSYWPVKGLRASAFPEAPAVQLARDLTRL